ncbi:glycosyltransferase family 77 protein [Thecamonas trahens ATCC 50062]|uniref:Glycosyltransferase family 77 protein n=1 Tax=Thecamonas trahens ATCC 50062 TaxID=461836 RepID=A0A0L0D3J6_THETB|nr:glycosyltransferase family 77 protein [Thecamonas trahens ATCC 50062]KNC46790.1 glycosyltransferase family 77 protein [Thecamonas trahens ATCC 50062]|eukprot:XP_013760065.1 glycosyltransferase family 77 protein [Thecamonas trahens ATCC 50062]
MYPRRRAGRGGFLRTNGLKLVVAALAVYVVVHFATSHTGSEPQAGRMMADQGRGSGASRGDGAGHGNGVGLGDAGRGLGSLTLGKRHGQPPPPPSPKAHGPDGGGGRWAKPAPKPSSHVIDHVHGEHDESEGKGEGEGEGKSKHDSNKWPQLSKEVVAKYASNTGKILVTFANHNHEDYIRNWVYHLASIPMDNYLVCAFDDELMEYLTQNGLNGAFVPAVLRKQTFEWGSAGFKKLNRYKWEAALSILEWGFGLFITDADTVFFRDPIRWVEDYGEDADVLASTDYLRPTTWKDELEDLTQTHIAWWAQNIGMMYLAPSERMITFFRKWTKLMNDNPDYGNQWSFTEMLSDGVEVDYSDGLQGYAKLELASNHTFWAANHSVILGMLPLAYFQNGHSYFEQRGWRKRNIQPVAVHTTYVYAFNGAKRHRFRDDKLWLDDDAYYSSGYFLAFDNVPPPELMVDHSWDVPFDKVPAHHLVLVDYQIQRVFEAMAVARALNRTLVLPPIYGTCDRYFAQLNKCRYPHAEKDEIQFPDVVPADHVFRQELLLEVREASFLTNPRVPMAVLSDRVFVNVCDELDGTREVVAPVAPAGTKGDVECVKRSLARFDANYVAASTVHLAKGLTDVELADALAPANAARVLHFSSMEGTFAGFEDSADALAFLKDARKWIGTWCCTYASGAIHYDSAPAFIPRDMISRVPPVYTNKFPYKDDTGQPLKFSPPPTPPKA